MRIKTYCLARLQAVELTCSRVFFRWQHTLLHALLYTRRRLQEGRRPNSARLAFVSGELLLVDLHLCVRSITVPETPTAPHHRQCIIEATVDNVYVSEV
jgi:hypothetical protein